jgi:hypothetical protein
MTEELQHSNLCGWVLSCLVFMSCVCRTTGGAVQRGPSHGFCLWAVFAGPQEVQCSVGPTRFLFMSCVCRITGGAVQRGPPHDFCLWAVFAGSQEVQCSVGLLMIFAYELCLQDHTRCSAASFLSCLVLVGCVCRTKGCAACSGPIMFNVYGTHSWLHFSYLQWNEITTAVISPLALQATFWQRNSIIYVDCRRTALSLQSWLPATSLCAMWQWWSMAC